MGSVKQQITLKDFKGNIEELKKLGMTEEDIINIILEK